MSYKTIGGYAVIDELTPGANGLVYRVSDGRRRYVIKLVDHVPNIGGRELKIHKAVQKNPKLRNVVLLKKHFMHDGYLALCLESFDCSLADMRADVSCMLTLQLALHLLRGMMELEAAGYIQDDLKPSNVLFRRESCRFAICDFGGCRPIGSPAVENTTDYAAPELIHKWGDKTSSATWVYSWGLILEEFITGQFGRLRVGQSITTVAPWIGSEFEMILRYCFAPEPSTRIELDELFELVNACAARANANRCTVCGAPIMPDSRGCFNCLCVVR